MSTTKKLSILIIMVGLLLPVASLGFVQGYSPNSGYIGSLSQMKIVYLEAPPPPAKPTSVNPFLERLTRESREREEEERKAKERSIPYRYVFALGCILVCLGTAGVLFNHQSNIPKEQAKNKGQNSPPETPVDLPEE